MVMELLRPVKPANETELRKREEVIRHLKQNYRGLYHIHKDYSVKSDKAKSTNRP